MNDIILAGFGGHAKGVIDSIEKSGLFHITGYTDPEFRGEYRGYKYLGQDDILQEYYDRGVKNAFITLGYLGKENIRGLLYKRLKESGFRLPAVIDPTAVLAKDVNVGEGTYIGKRCVINSGTEIGRMCILNTGATVEHENKIGDFSHISVNSTLCGNVCVDTHCFVGANATVIQNRRVGAGSIVGAGSVVLRDILPKEIVYGVVKAQRSGKE